MRCTAVARDVATLNLKDAFANVNTKKTVRVIIHFPLKSNGTENFTETKDCFGNPSNHNGYWFAEKFIEIANYCLRNNVEMQQQLSYKKPIPVNPINIQLVLAGVVFHRNDNLFYYVVNEKNYKMYANPTTLSLTANYVDQTIKEDALHVFLYNGQCGYGISEVSGNICVVQGVDNVYKGYINHNKNDWYFEGWIVRLSLHEMGHCFSLKHPKLSSNGKKCESMDCDFDDDCSDTPTYQELIADGYKNPYEWNGEEQSNNFMDYSSYLAAWTPCQIERVHKNIAQRARICSNSYKNTTATLSSSVNQENKIVVARRVTAKNVAIAKDKALFANCVEFQTNGTFEVPLGATLEIK